jgi:hypothetical protein
LDDRYLRRYNEIRLRQSINRYRSSSVCTVMGTDAKQPTVLLVLTAYLIRVYNSALAYTGWCESNHRLILETDVLAKNISKLSPGASFRSQTIICSK